MQEYTRRFKQKTKDEIVKDLKYQTNLARKKTRELGKLAKKNKIVNELTSKKSEEIIKQAKKKGYEISETILQKSGIVGSRLKKTTKSNVHKGITAGKKLKTSKQKNLELLENLGELKKAGVITSKEFQEKKKKILSKI